MGLRIVDRTTDVMRMTEVREKYGYDLWKLAVGSYQVEGLVPEQPWSECKVRRHGNEKKGVISLERCVTSAFHDKSEA